MVAALLKRAGSGWKVNRQRAALEVQKVKRRVKVPETSWSMSLSCWGDTLPILNQSVQSVQSVYPCSLLSSANPHLTISLHREAWPGGRWPPRPSDHPSLRRRSRSPAPTSKARACLGSFPRSPPASHGRCPSEFPSDRVQRGMGGGEFRGPVMPAEDFGRQKAPPGALRISSEKKKKNMIKSRDFRFFAQKTRNGSK